MYLANHNYYIKNSIKYTPFRYNIFFYVKLKLKLPTSLTVRSETVNSIQTTELQRFIYLSRYYPKATILICRGTTSITLLYLFCENYHYHRHHHNGRIKPFRGCDSSFKRIHVTKAKLPDIKYTVDKYIIYSRTCRMHIV